MTKVSRMYNTKAYIYQYNKYGLTNEHFERMMLDIEQSKYILKKKKIYIYIYNKIKKNKKKIDNIIF